MRVDHVAVAFFVLAGSAVAAPASAPTFRDCADCPEMVEIPAGQFMMGSPANEAWRSDDEGPQRKVTIDKAFAVGKYEVTFGEWDACVAGGGCNGYSPTDETWGRGRQAVFNVSWDDAQAYVQWLSKTTGKTYRLLTEAEWEYAARAGATTPFSFGAKIRPDQANYNSLKAYGGGPTGEPQDRIVAVGMYPANRFGLHDMHGNVSEWVEDCYSDSLASNPADGSAAAAADCEKRVVRGGFWAGYPVGLRAASRDNSNPAIRDRLKGFRVARSN